MRRLRYLWVAVVLMSAAACALTDTFDPLETSEATGGVRRLCHPYADTPCPADYTIHP